MDGITIATIVAIGVTLIGSIIAGSMRFSAIETRVNDVYAMRDKVDRIAEAIARIEGKLSNTDRREEHD